MLLGNRIPPSPLWRIPPKRRKGSAGLTASTTSAEAFQYFELWNKLECEGGARRGFFLPITPARRLRLNGDDALSFGIPKEHRLAALIAKNWVVREVLSADGLTVREWFVDRASVTTGPNLVMSVECVPILTALTRYPIDSTDADGYVYRDTGAIQLRPQHIVTRFIRSNTPSWIADGTITPIDPVEVPFSGDSALSGMRRLEQLVEGYEVSLTRHTGNYYLVNFSAIGATAPVLYLRTAKNIIGIQRSEQPGQVTRITQVTGADGDDGPAGLAWAYWEVDSVTGAGPYLVALKAIHGGPGPIAFNGQFSHANLPSGADSLYLELMNGSLTQITDSFGGATQTLEVASAPAVGDWVRIVASSTGKHLTFLDAPAEMATTGVLAGQFESPWDDTVCVVKNALQEAWPSTMPTGWTGLGTKTTAEGEWLTSGAALAINQVVIVGAQIAAPPARTWKIKSRKSIFSAVAWVRLKALTVGGDITLQVKLNGAIVNTGLAYVTPANVWRQLKIEGIDLTPYVGQTVSLSVEIVKSGTSGTVNMLVDSMCLYPGLTARPVTTGSNAARIWQGANGFLDDQRTRQVTYSVTAAGLARMGRANQVAPSIGGTVVIDDEELGTVTARMVEISDQPGDPRTENYVISTLPSRLSRKQVKPLQLVVPFFEPIEVRVADRDTRNAALTIKATVTTSDATSVTVAVVASDTLGGTPTIDYEVFGAAYLSGAYVFSRPAAGAGTGRAVFTASLANRTSVTDAIDIPEQDSVPPSLDVTVTPGTTTFSIGYASDGVVTVSIDGAAYGVPAASPISVSRPAVGAAAKVYNFKATKNGVETPATVIVPALVNDGPSLTVQVTEGDTSSSIAYSGDSVEVSIDGGAFGAPATATPLVVSRNSIGGVNKLYVFRGVKDGITVTNSVTVPAQRLLPIFTSIVTRVQRTIMTGEMLLNVDWALSYAPSGYYAKVFARGPNDETETTLTSSTGAYTYAMQPFAADGVTALKYRDDTYGGTLFSWTWYFRVEIYDGANVLQCQGSAACPFFASKT